MANNNNIYNAVLAGAGGGNQQRWITDTNAADYNSFLATIQVIAQSVDEAIDPIVGDANIAQTALMQSICQAIFAARYVQSTSEAVYAEITEAIVALYTKLSTGLLDPTSGGSIDPLSVDYWTDPNTTVPTDQQTGSISAPFSTLQAAYDAAFAASADLGGEVPAIILQPTSYSGDVEDPNGIAVAFQSLGQRLASRGGLINGDLIGSNGTSWLLKQVDIQGNISTTASVRFSDAGQTGGTMTCDNLIADTNSSIDTLTAATCLLKQNSQLSTGNISSQIQLEGGSIVNIVNGNGNTIISAQWSQVTSATNCNTITTQFCQVGSLEAVVIDLRNCKIIAGSTITCDFLTIDTLTYEQAVLDGVTFTVSSTLTFANPQVKGTVSIAVPAIATSTDVSYVNTTLTGVLADKFAVGDAVTVNPQADIPGAGATIASARISAANTLRVGFRGVTTGGSMNFTVARPS